MLKILFVYWATIFFHELGHWTFIKIFRRPYKIKVQWFPFAIYTHYKADKTQTYIISSAGILNGFGFIFAYYIFDRDPFMLTLLLFLNIIGSIVDIYQMIKIKNQ